MFTISQVLAGRHNTRLGLLLAQDPAQVDGWEETDRRCRHPFHPPRVALRIATLATLEKLLRRATSPISHSESKMGVR